ncbi:MAG: endolytic transglycosylase MltG [Corynebacterium sp.]|nr:endolytic transglycosylase MltG [Corynebacterium sp.]
MAARNRSVTPRPHGTGILAACLLLIIGAIVYLSWAVQNGETGADYRGDGNGTDVIVEIAAGSSVSEIGPELVDAGVVKSNGAFQSAAASNAAAANVQPGFYRLQEHMSSEAAVAALVNPDLKIPNLTVAPGATLMDTRVVGGDVRLGIYSKIAAITCAVEGQGSCLSVEDLQQVAATMDPATLGVPDWAIEPVTANAGSPKRLEGLIEPGEYVIDPRSSAEDILTQLVSESAQDFTETGIVDRAGAINLSPYQLLTAASLVEREAPADGFAKVARVILNRLNEPMRLEFDSTVNYELPEQEVATTDADRARVTAWNTYAMDGLPATPIASPSLEAVEAMEFPAEGDWLFFVTVDKEGTTEFNRDFEAHQEAVQRSIDNGVLDSNR